MNTSEKIIIVVVAIVAIVVIVYFGFLKNENKFVYYTVKGSTSTRELIENYKDFDKLAKEAKLKDEITNAIDFSKSELLDTFNEEYFTNKKVAVISAYEDTSRAYMYSIDKYLRIDEIRASKHSKIHENKDVINALRNKCNFALI